MCLGMLLVFVPSRQIDSVWLFEVKLLLSCVVFLAVGTMFYWINSGRKR